MNVTIDDIIQDYIMCAYVMSFPNTKYILHAWVCLHMVYLNYRIEGFYHGYKRLLIKNSSTNFYNLMVLQK